MSIARSAWTRLEGPADGHRSYRVRDAGSYLAAHYHALKRNGRPEQWESTEEKIAYVNHGRWVIDCECGNGCLTGPEWDVACCFDCGCTHTAIRFPDTATAIEQLLIARPARANQNWRAPETEADLRRENAAHGLG